MADRFEDEKKTENMSVRMGPTLKAEIEREATFLGLKKGSYLFQIAANFFRRERNGAQDDIGALGQALLDALDTEQRRFRNRFEAVVRLLVLAAKGAKKPPPKGSGGSTSGATGSA